MSGELREYLRGKRVVLVGPSACLEGQGRGAWIDEHDVIARVNLYELGAESVRADVGSRTDLLYHVLFSEKHRADIAREHTADEVERWRADGLRFLVTQQAATSGRTRDLHAVSGDLPIVHIPKLRDELRWACGTPPNTGTIAITHLLSLPIASLDVVGFDFYASPYYAAYVGFTPEDAARGGGDGRAVAAWGLTDSRVEIHEQQGQKSYLRDLYRREERLRFDEAALAGLGLPSEGPSITALVPMKGNSERVPGKNTRIVAGKPLLAWLLTALVSARRVSRVVVDTDDEQIAALVREHAPSVEILTRPDDLLDGDAVTGNDLIAWELTQVEGEHFGQFHVTSPLLEAATIDRAVDEYFRGLDQHDSLFAVSEHHIWLFRADGSPVNSDTRRLVRSQDLEPLYEDNNAIHLFSRASFARTGSRMGERPRMFPISKVEATDIDYEDDLRIAEALLQLREAEARERATRKAKSPMGAVVYSTQKQPDGSYAVRGAVNGDKRTVYAQFEGDPTIAMCKQALLDGGTSAAGAVESGSDTPPGESDSTAGQQPPADSTETTGTEGDAERAVLVTALLDLSVEALEEQLPTVEDAALLEAALAVEQSEDGKGRKGAVAALEASLAALAEGVKA